MIPTLLYFFHKNAYSDFCLRTNKQITLEPIPLNHSSEEFFPGIGLFDLTQPNGPFVRFDENLTNKTLVNFLIQNIIDYYGINNSIDYIDKAIQTVKFAHDFIKFLYDKNYISLVDGVWYLNNSEK